MKETPTHKKNGDLFGTFNLFGGVSETYVRCGKSGQAHGSLWGNDLVHALQRLRVLWQKPSFRLGDVRGLAEILVARTSL